MGDEGQGEAMIRARFRVEGAGVCIQSPRGDLVTVCGRWAGRDDGERTQQETHADRAGASWRGRSVIRWMGSDTGIAVRQEVESLAAVPGRG